MKNPIQQANGHSAPTHAKPQRSLNLRTMFSAVVAFAMAACNSSPTHQETGANPNQAKGYGQIAASAEPGTWGERVRLTWEFLFNKPAHTRPDRTIPVDSLSKSAVHAAPEGSLWRLGHSTILLKLNGRFWLTDPVFSERASPLSWLGPRRFHAPPIALEDLPELEAVILSHDHYDHLDEPTIRALATRTAHFLAPRGVGELLVEWGIPKEKISELDWWAQVEIAGLTLTATPARHFSGRGLFDSNRRLWCSWVIKSEQFRVFFSGDSGYFDGFRTIGEKYGPFDVTLIEAGAYDQRWSRVHMLPEQTIQAHKDLRGAWLLPIHNSTFDLAFHAWNEPMERLSEIALRLDVPLMTPVIGAQVSLSEPRTYAAWWRPDQVHATQRRAVASVPDAIAPQQTN